MIPTFTRAYEASGEATGFLIAALTADGKAVLATGPTNALIGVFDRQGADAGGMADVHRAGLVSVQLGATVAAGAPLTADATGRAVLCTAGAGRRYIGFADSAGVVGDIIDVFLAPGILNA